MIDLCTVVFQDELDVLQLQAQSIELYGHDIDVIRVITNDDCVVDPAWWGTLADQVQVLHRSQFGDHWSHNGWLSQQALKILGSAHSSNPWTMILDAKTILVKPIDVFDCEGRPQVGSLDIFPVFAESQTIVNQLFGIDLQRQLGPGGVPFFVHNQQARDMIDHLQSTTQMSFAEWFQSQGMLTEFMLYSGYLQSLGMVDKLYNTKTAAMTVCNVCHSEVADWNRKFAMMTKATTVSVHRNAWRQLTAQQQSQYIDFLQSRGIK